MKFLIFVLFNISAMANFSSPIEIQKKIDDCSYKLKTYVQCKGDCIKIDDFKCEYYEIVEETQMKEDVESCIDESDCQSKMASKSCSSSQANAVYVLNPNEVYCTYLRPKMVAENASKKALYEAEQATKQAEMDALKSQKNDMELGKELYAKIMLMNKAKGLSKGQRKTLRTDLKTIRDDLFDGDICSAREDIAGLTADGTLITDADKTSVLGLIDAYKVCP